MLAFLGAARGIAGEFYEEKIITGDRKPFQIISCGKMFMFELQEIFDQILLYEKNEGMKDTVAQTKKLFNGRTFLYRCGTVNLYLSKESGPPDSIVLISVDTARKKLDISKATEILPNYTDEMVKEITDRIREEESLKIRAIIARKNVVIESINWDKGLVLSGINKSGMEISKIDLELIFSINNKIIEKKRYSHEFANRVIGKFNFMLNNVDIKENIDIQSEIIAIYDKNGVNHETAVKK